MRSTCCGVFRNWESKQLSLVVSISEKLAPISGKLLFRHDLLSHSLIMLSPGSCLQVCLLIFVPNNINSRDRGASLRLGGGGGGRGGTISDSILGGTRQFFLLSLYHFKNIGGGARAPPPCPLTPRSLNSCHILQLSSYIGIESVSIAGKDFIFSLGLQHVNQCWYAAPFCFVE